MCISPCVLNDGQSVACRKCWQCLEHKIDDWVGRCIAESKFCVASASITLTYGRDEDGNESHARAAILTYSDVQKYMKQLRNRGHPARYMAVGEHGSKKGRSHWHIIAFFKKALPDGFLDYGGNSWCREPRDEPVFVPLVWNKRFNEPCWPHGFSHWVPVAPGHAKGSIRYACKYINKDFGDPAAQSKYAMSKRPPMGAEYFEHLAQMYVDQGISPGDPFYTFPNEARRKGGEIIRFRLEGKSADLYAEHFVTKWRAQRADHWPHSEFIEEWEDKKTREEWDRETGALEERVRPERRWAFNPPMGYSDADIHSCPVTGAPMVKTPDGPLWYGRNSEGKRAWQSVHPVPEKPAALKRRAPRLQERTPYQWVEHLSLRGVFWISRSSSNLGKWKRARTITANGKPVWMQSQMPNGNG